MAEPQSTALLAGDGWWLCTHPDTTRTPMLDKPGGVEVRCLGCGKRSWVHQDDIDSGRAAAWLAVPVVVVEGVA